MLRLCAYVLLTVSHSNALRIPSANQDSCTITFAPHDGFGNQLYGAFGAGYIALMAGCKLQMPPILGHGKKNGGIAYGSENDCLKGDRKEKGIMGGWFDGRFKGSKFTYEQIFKPTSLISQAPMDTKKLVFLPVHCSLWQEQGGDEKRYGEYLKNFIKKTNPVGAYSIGSGYNAGAPRLPLSELFSDFSAPVLKAVSDTKSQIASIVGTNKSYACIHLRSGDASMGSTVKDDAAKKWIEQHLADLKKPLFIASAETDQNIKAALENVCSKTKCIKSREVMPQGDYGLSKDDKAMMVELAVCSEAKEIYLPHAHHKILHGNKISAPAEQRIFRSTFSDTISEMALWHSKTAHVNINHPWWRPLNSVSDNLVNEPLQARYNGHNGTKFT